MSSPALDQINVLGFTKTRKSKSSLLGGTVKWNSVWEFLYRSLAYSFTVEALLCNHKIGEWNEECNCLQLIIIYVFVGMPLYYTQIVIGQYSQMGVMCYRNILPIARGLSYTILICVVLKTFNYGIWLGDSMLYFLATMQTNLPWLQCPENISANVCIDDKSIATCNASCLKANAYISSRYYHMATFLGYIDEQKDHRTILPPINRVVALCTAWVIIFLFVHKVFVKLKKVLLVQVVFSCALMLLLCTGTISASGGKAGIEYLFENLWIGFTFKRTWTRAVATVIIGMDLGEAFAMTSGAKLSPKQNVTIWLLCFMFTKAVVSAFSAIFYQSIIGMIAFRTKTPLRNTDVLELPFDFLTYFISIPQGLGYLTVPQVWSMLYFSFCMTVFLMNIISRIVIVSAVFADVHSFIVKYGKYILVIYCLLAFIVCSILIGERQYFYSCYFIGNTVKLLEIFNATYMSLMIYYVYGVTKLSDDVQFLTGTPPTKFWKVSWYCLPIIMAYSFYEEYVYYVQGRDGRGRLLINITTLICILPIPVFWIVESVGHIKARHLTGMFRSTDSWGPADPEERHKRLSFNPRLQTKYHSRSTACNHHCFITYKGLRILHQEESRCREAFLTEFENRTAAKTAPQAPKHRKSIALEVLDENKE